MDGTALSIIDPQSGSLVVAHQPDPIIPPALLQADLAFHVRQLQLAHVAHQWELSFQWVVSTLLAHAANVAALFDITTCPFSETLFVLSMFSAPHPFWKTADGTRLGHLIESAIIEFNMLLLPRTKDVRLCIEACLNLPVENPQARETLAVLRTLPEMTASELCRTINACSGNIGLAPTPGFWTTLANVVTSKAKTFVPGEVADCIVAFGKASLASNHPAWKALSDAVEFLIDQFSASELVSCLEGMSRTMSASKSLIDSLIPVLQSQAHQMTPTELATCISACSRFNIVDPSLWNVLISTVVNSSSADHQMTALQFSKLVFSLAEAVQTLPKFTMEHAYGLSQAILRILPQMDPVCFSLCVFASSKLLPKEFHVWRALAEKAPEVVSRCVPTELAVIVLGFAQSDCPIPEVLRATLAKSVMAKLAEMSVSNLTRCILGFSRMKYNAQSLWTALERSLERLGPNIPSADLPLLVVGFSAMTSHHYAVSPSTWQLLENGVLCHLATFWPSDLATCVRGFALARQGPSSPISTSTSIWPCLEAAVLLKLPEMHPKDVAACIWGFAKTKSPPISSLSENQENEESPSALQWRPSFKLWNALASRLSLVLDQLDPRSFQCCIEGFVTAFPNIAIARRGISSNLRPPRFLPPFPQPARCLASASTPSSSWMSAYSSQSPSPPACSSAPHSAAVLCCRGVFAEMVANIALFTNPNPDVVHPEIMTTFF